MTAEDYSDLSIRMGKIKELDRSIPLKWTTSRLFATVSPHIECDQNHESGDRGSD